jgi:hypothetical protein
VSQRLAQLDNMPTVGSDYLLLTVLPQRKRIRPPDQIAFAQTQPGADRLFGRSRNVFAVKPTADGPRIDPQKLRGFVRRET